MRIRRLEEFGIMLNVLKAFCNSQEINKENNNSCNNIINTVTVISSLIGIFEIILLWNQVGAIGLLSYLITFVFGFYLAILG